MLKVDSRIKSIKAVQILDSRGNPTLKVAVSTSKVCGVAMVPSGASTGIYEALELRDGTKHYGGKSVLTACHNVNSLIANKLRGMNVLKQKDIDETMILLDGTENKARLGANAIVGVSLAAARCGACVKNKELYSYLGEKKILPIPFSNIINGGQHAEGRLRIQEFMIAPVKAKSFSEATMMTAEVYHFLKDIIEKRYGKQATHVGDEGGFAPPVYDPHDAINLILRAINELGYEHQIKLALDAAASEFYDRKAQKYVVESKRALDRNELIDYYVHLIKSYPIISLEDPFDQDDFYPYQELMKKVKIQVVGDDLLVTNHARIKTAFEQKLCNALLLKVNQIGTLTEALEANSMAVKNKWGVMVSHRSGETEDTFIADLAVAIGCGQIKLGAPCRAERTSKFNRLMEIEEQLGKKAKYSKLFQ